MRTDDKRSIAALIFFIFIIITVLIISCDSKDKENESSNNSTSNIQKEENSNSNNISNSNSNNVSNINSNSNSNSNKVNSNSSSNSNSKVSVTSIKFAKTSYDVGIGNNITLSVSISPSNATNKSVTWKSSDTSIATVSDKGLVIGKKKGTVTITATTKDGYKKATVKVNVKQGKTLTATFLANEPSNRFGQVTEISENKVSCVTIGNSCTITTPTFTRKDWTSIGWNTNKNAKTAQVGTNKKLTLTKNVTYYAITKKELKATFIRTGSRENTTVYKKCNIYNTNTKCKVTFPYYTKYGSYDNTWHYKKTPNAYSALYMSGSTLELTGDRTYYAQFHHPSYYTAYSRKVYHEDRDFSITKVYKIGYTSFEYEKGIPASVINKHYTFMKKAYKDIPWLFIPGKVFVLMPDTYKKYSIAYGLTSASGAYSFMDVQYDIGYGGISENATLHEMAHAWDGYYGFKTGTAIGKQKDLLNFYNSLSDDKKEGLNSGEWIAGFITEYYWHYMGADASMPSYVGYKDKYTATEKKTIVNLFQKYINNSKKWI